MLNASQVPREEFLLKEYQGVLVVVFSGPKLPWHAKDPLFSLVDAGGHVNLVLNFENVRVITSAPISILVALRTKVALVGGKVKLCSLDPLILQIIQASHTEGIFEIYDDEQAAIESFWMD